jgi:hypothetical protein
MTDNRIEYARAVSARTRIEVALEQVIAARREIGSAIGPNHDAARSLDDVTVVLQRAHGKLNIAIPRIP